MPGHLTPRELEAMDLLTAHPGWTNDDLAEHMGIGARTVNKFLGAVFVKYGVGNRTEAVLTHLELRRSHRRSRMAEGQLELA